MSASKGIKYCFICGKVSEKEKVKVSTFFVSEKKLEDWQKIIPKSGLKVGSKLCDRHFDDTDIVKGKEIQDKFYPFSNWRLSLNAIPKHYLNPPVALPSLLSKGETGAQINHSCETNSSLPVCRPVTHYVIVQDSPPTFQNSKTTTTLIENDSSLNISADLLPSASISLAQNDNINLASLVPSNCDHDYALRTARPTIPAEKDRTVMAASEIQDSQDESSSAGQDSGHSNGIPPSSSTPTIIEACLDLDFAGYRDFISDIKLPASQWCWSFNEITRHVICSCHCISHDGVMTIKTVRILTKTKVQLFVNGQSINPPSLKLEFRTKTDLSNIIEAFHFKTTCKGIVEESLAFLEVSDKCAGIKEGNVWRSKKCLGFTFTDGSLPCSKCQLLRKHLELMKKKELKKPKDRRESYRRKLNTCRKALQRMKSKAEKFSATIGELQKERQKLIWNGFDAKMKILNPKERLVVKTMVAKAEVNPGRNDKLTAMRYDPEFLADCLLIKQKSSAMYKHLRSKGILPLPSEATLKRTAKKINLDGLNSEQLNNSHHSNQPHLNQKELDSNELDPLDLDQQTPRQPSDENMDNERSGTHDCTVAMSPEIELLEEEEITVSISDEMIVEMYSVE